MAEDPETFASRWSRRKRAVEAEEAAPKPDAQALAAEEEARLQEEEANRLAAEAIDLEAVKYGDDFSVFLKRGVPDLLRRKALRKFFASDPLLANLDGLNDYDEDYNNPAHRVYKSAWDAAKGYLDTAEETVQAVGEKVEKAEAALDALAETPAPGPDDEAPEAPEELPDEAPQEVPVPAPEQEAPRRVSLRRRLEG